MPNAKRIYRVFQIGVLLKGAHALFELAGGLSILFVSTDTISRALISATWFTRNLDRITAYILDLAVNLSPNEKLFGAIYLLVHGAVDMGLVVGLLRRKMWAFPAALAVLGGFVAYQVYRLAHTHGILLMVVTAFDLVVMWLIWREYGVLRESKILPALSSETRSQESV